MADVAPRNWVDGGTTRTAGSGLHCRPAACRQTAEIAFAGCTVPVVQDARLRECNYGALNGLPVARLESERIRHVDTPTRTVRAIVRC
jgi:hypothetical protein